MSTRNTFIFRILVAPVPIITLILESSNPTDLREIIGDEKGEENMERRVRKRKMERRREREMEEMRRV